VWLWCVNVVLITGGISQGKIYFLILLKYAKPQSRVSPLLLRLVEFDLVCRRVTCMQTFSLGHVEEVQSRCADRGGYRLLPPIPPFQHYPLFQDSIVLPLFPFRDWEDLAYIEPRGESSPLVKNNSVLLLL